MVLGVLERFGMSFWIGLGLFCGSGLGWEGLQNCRFGVLGMLLGVRPRDFFLGGRVVWAFGGRMLLGCWGFWAVFGFDVWNYVFGRFPPAQAPNHAPRSPNLNTNRGTSARFRVLGGVRPRECFCGPGGLGF